MGDPTTKKNQLVTLALAAVLGGGGGVAGDALLGHDPPPPDQRAFEQTQDRFIAIESRVAQVETRQDVSERRMLRWQLSTLRWISDVLFKLARAEGIEDIPPYPGELGEINP